MLLKDAIELIKSDHITKTGKQLWADLGCGSGIFTAALANLLPAESKIIAVDKNRSTLNRIPSEINNVAIKKIDADLTTTELPGELDGILMVNSLHYVKEKDLLLKKMLTRIKEDGCFIIGEYDTDTSNPWIPFPVSFKSLANLFDKEGFVVTKLNEKPSVYRRANIYSAVVRMR